MLQHDILHIIYFTIILIKKKYYDHKKNVSKIIFTVDDRIYINIVLVRCMFPTVAQLVFHVMIICKFKF